MTITALERYTRGTPTPADVPPFSLASRGWLAPAVEEWGGKEEDAGRWACVVWGFRDTQARTLHDKLQSKLYARTSAGPGCARLLLLRLLLLLRGNDLPPARAPAAEVVVAAMVQRVELLGVVVRERRLRCLACSGSRDSVLSVRIRRVRKASVPSPPSH